PVRCWPFSRPAVVSRLGCAPMRLRKAVAMANAQQARGHRLKPGVNEMICRMRLHVVRDNRTIHVLNPAWRPRTMNRRQLESLAEAVFIKWRNYVIAANSTLIHHSGGHRIR